jgi:hypothetical protein
VVKKTFQLRTILPFSLVLVVISLSIVACNDVSDLLFGTPTPAPTNNSIILVPANNTRVLLDGQVQIQSVHPADNVSRVELWIWNPTTQRDELLRSDIPINSNLTQPWIPKQTGTITVTLRVYDVNNALLPPATRIYEVIPNAIVKQGPGEPTPLPPVPPEPTVKSVTPFPSTPEPTAGAMGNNDFSVQVVAISTVTPTVPALHYPPPAPIPGVPPGPVQSPLLNNGPPVCDAAEYLGPYASDTSLREVITEADDLAPQVVGGTTVFRAWRLQNVGTCTWGTGYELAFYGGRSMGSGGVAFDSTFPTEPVRPNTIVDRGRLIVPEGKPNQIAILEISLVAPVTPGIHQSYWRMRNPHGVFFGPIIGVTMEIVRDCAPGIYGAPNIEKFEILGFGSVYIPETNPPVSRSDIKVIVGQNVTLDYLVNNATNFDIVFTDPTGETQAVSTSDTGGRFSFPAKTLGKHNITLYADNGSCTIVQTVIVNVVPRTGEQFVLDILLASNAQFSTADTHVKRSAGVAPGTIVMSYNNRVDTEVGQVQNYTQKWRRGAGITSCLIGDILCGTTTGGWQPESSVLVNEIGSSASAGSATLNVSLPTEIQDPNNPTVITTSVQSVAPGCSVADAASNMEVAFSFCAGAQINSNGQTEQRFSNAPWYICGANKDISDGPPPPSACGSSTASSSGTGFNNGSITNQTANPSCTLNLLGRDFNIPVACNDVPIMAGVSLVLLLVAFWILLK